MPHSMYRALYEHSMDAVFLAAPDGSIFSANPAACAMFRMTEARICSCGRADIVDMAYPAFRAFMAERERHGKARGELMFIRGDGERFLGDVAWARFSDERGDARSVFIIRDMTERVAARQRLVESEERYRSVVTAMAEGVVFQQADGRITAVNPAAERILGRSAESMMGLSSEDESWSCIREDGSPFPGHEHPGMVALNSGTSQHGVMMGIRLGGDLRWLSINAEPILDADGRPKGVVTTFQDITESKRAEEELRASEARFRSFVDHAMDAFFLHGEDGVILDVNRQACLSLGYSREELIGMTPAVFDADLSVEFRDALRERVNRGETVTFATHHRRKDGGIFPVEVSVRPFPGGERIMQISMARDISERLRVAVDLHTLNRELRAISHCHHALLRAVDQQGLLEEVCRIICDEAGYRMAWVGLVDPDMTVRPVAWAGVEAGYLADTGLSHGDATKPRRGPVAEAACSGSIVYVQDIEHDPRMAPWRDMALARGYHSSIAIPLKTDQQAVFAVLSIYAMERNAYVLEEIRMLDELADDLAFGIDVLRIRRERMETEAALQVKTEELNISNRQLRRLTARREEIREQERMEIARNVHDELGQLLTALQMRLTTLALEYGKGREPLNLAIKSAQDLTEKAMKTARDVISALRPASLDMGLAVSLEWLAQRHAISTGIACRVKISDGWEEQLDDAGIIALYRIAQESLTNIARHAHASQAVITLGRSGDTCELVVRDDGLGFDPEHTREDSFGLIGIRERVAMLGGTFAISSNKGKGSVLRVTLPLAELGWEA